MENKLALLTFASTLTSLFAIVDPFAAIPVFMSITDRYSPSERKVLVRRASMIAASILSVFALSGERIFHLFGISVESFRIAGGILLLLLGIEQLSAKRERVKDEEETESFAREDLSIFPIATPLLAGPGAISTVVLQGSQTSGTLATVVLILAILSVFLASYFVLNSAPYVFKILGRTGLNLLTRLMGMILSAMAVQYIIDGIFGFWRQFQHVSG